MKPELFKKETRDIIDKLADSILSDQTNWCSCYIDIVMENGITMINILLYDYDEDNIPEYVRCVEHPLFEDYKPQKVKTKTH